MPHIRRPLSGPGAHKLRAKPTHRMGAHRPTGDQAPRTVPGYLSEGSAHKKRCASQRTFHGKPQRCVLTAGHTGKHANGTVRWGT